MDRLMKLKASRRTYSFLYYLISVFFILIFAESILGPFCVFFSWASAFYFLVFRLLGIARPLFGEVSNLSVGSAEFWVTFIFLSIVLVLSIAFYMRSITVINTRLSKRFKWTLPYPILVYYGAGVIAGLLLNIRYDWSGAWEPSLNYQVYPVLAALACLYIFLDWRLARKIAGLEAEIKSQVAG